MKEVLKSLADFVFRFKTFIFLMVVGYTLIALHILVADAPATFQKDAEPVEQTQRLTPTCYCLICSDS